MTDSEIIDALGGSVAVAMVCDTQPQAVSQWRRKGIPDARRQYLAEKFPQLVTYQRKYQPVKEAA